MPLVGVVLGSKRDEPWLKELVEVLEEMGIDYEVRVLSAHRNPEDVREYGLNAKGRGLEVVIALAGYAAHLPGVLASWTDLPVIGVPLPTSELKGIDALYSIVQMPTAVPVACLGIGQAKNAGLLAARILSIKHPEIASSHQKYLKKLLQI